MTDTQRNTGSADVPSLEDLARRLLDLWQEQIAAAAANPDLASQAARLMAASPLPGMWLGQMGQMGLHGGGTQAGGPPLGMDMAKAWSEFAKNWMHPTDKEGHSDGSRNPGETGTANTAQAGTTAPATAHQPGRVDLDELRTRLAGLEKRLGELGGSTGPGPRGESEHAKSGSGPKRKPKSAGRGNARTGTSAAKRRPTRPDDGASG